MSDYSAWSRAEREQKKQKDTDKPNLSPLPEHRAFPAPTNSSELVKGFLSKSSVPLGFSASPGQPDILERNFQHPRAIWEQCLGQSRFLQPIEKWQDMRAEWVTQG